MTPMGSCFFQVYFYVDWNTCVIVATKRELIGSGHNWIAKQEFRCTFTYRHYINVLIIN